MKNRRIGVGISFPFKIDEFKYGKVEASLFGDISDDQDHEKEFDEIWQAIEKQVEEKAEKLEKQGKNKQTSPRRRGGE